MPTTLLEFVPLAADIRGSSTDRPTFNTRNGHRILEFKPGVDDEAFFTSVMPEAYAAAGISVVIEFMADNNTAGNMIIGVAFERLEVGVTDLDSDGFATEKTVSIAVPATSGQLVRATIAFSDAEIDGIVIADAFRMRLRREGTNVSDTASTTIGQMTICRISQAATGGGGGGGGGGFFTDGAGTDAGIGKGAVAPVATGANSLAQGNATTANVDQALVHGRANYVDASSGSYAYTSYRHNVMLQGRDQQLIGVAGSVLMQGYNNDLYGAQANAFSPALAYTQGHFIQGYNIQAESSQGGFGPLFSGPIFGQGRNLTLAHAAYNAPPIAAIGADISAGTVSGTGYPSNTCNGLFVGKNLTLTDIGNCLVFGEQLTLDDHSGSLIGGDGMTLNRSQRSIIWGRNHDFGAGAASGPQNSLIVGYDHYCDYFNQEVVLLGRSARNGGVSGLARRDCIVFGVGDGSNDPGAKQGGFQFAEVETNDATQTNLFTYFADDSQAKMMTFEVCAYERVDAGEAAAFTLGPVIAWKDSHTGNLNLRIGASSTTPHAFTREDSAGAKSGSWAVELDTDGTETMRVRVTGTAGDNVAWVMMARWVEAKAF